MIRIIIISSVIILIMTFKSANGASRNIDNLCVQNLRRGLALDNSLYISVCKNVELEGIPRTGMLLPYMLNLKIRSSTFEINLNLRKKHYYIATLNTPIVYEYYNSNEEVVVEHTNVSKILGIHSVGYYSDLRKNAAMVGLYDKDLRVEGVIGKYTLRFVPIVDRYILFAVSFASAPILNQNFIVRDVVDKVPSYDLKSHLDKVTIQLLVALDDVLISGKFTKQSIIGAIIHINAADFLFSKFTHPSISLSIHGIILPYLERSAIYGRRYKDISENSRLENIRTTQIRESGDFFISKHHHFPVNRYNLGIVITNLPICNERAKNCNIYVSGYPFYDCPHHVNLHGKATIVRTPDFYGNYAAIAQNIKTRFVRKILRRFEKADEDINLNDPLKGWSRTDVENLSSYFQSTEAKCWQRIIPTTPRPKIRTITRRPESRYDLRPRSATITTTTTTERISEAKIRRPTESEGKIDVLNYTKEEDSAVKFKNKTLDIRREEGLEQSIHSVKNESSKARGGNHANVTTDRPSIREDIKKEIKVSPESLERPPTVQPEKIRNNTSENESLSHKARIREYGNGTVDRPSVGKDIKKEIKVPGETLEQPATASPEKIINNMMKEDKLHNPLIETKKSVTKPNTTLEMNQLSGSKSKTSQVSVKTVVTTSKPLNVSRHEQIQTIKPDALKNRTETRNAISGSKMKPSRSLIINVTATTPKSTIEQTIGRTPSTKPEKSDSRITREEKKSIPTSNPNDKSKSLVTSVTSEEEKKSNSTTVRPKSIALKTEKPMGEKFQKNATLDKTITVTPKQVNTPSSELISTVNLNAMNETKHLRFNRSIIRVYSRTSDPELMDFFDEGQIPEKVEAENKAIEKNTQPTPTSNPSNEAKNSIDSKTLKQKGTSNLKTTTAKPVTVSSNGKVITPKIDALKNRTDTNNTRNGSEIKPPYLSVNKVNSTTPKSTEEASKTVKEDKKSSPIDNPKSTITSLTPKSTEKSSLRNLTTSEVKNMTVNNDKAKQLNVSNPERTQKEKSNGLKYEIDVKNAINVSKNAPSLQPITIVNITTPKTIIKNTIKENPLTKISKSENGTIENKTVITSSLNENDEKKSHDTQKEQKLAKKSASQNLTTTNPIKAKSEILAINKLDQLNSEAKKEVNRRNMTKLRPVDKSKTERTNIENPNGLKNDSNTKNVMNNLDKENLLLIIGGNTSIIATTSVEHTRKKGQIAEAQKSETETIAKDTNSTFTPNMADKRKSLKEDWKKVENTSISVERRRKIKEQLINETTHNLTLPLSTDGGSYAINHLKIDDSNSTAMLSTSSNRDHNSTADKGNLKTTEVKINAKNAVASRELLIVGNNPPSSVSSTSTSRGLTEQTAEKSSVEKKVISRNEIFKPNSSLLKPLEINGSNIVGSNNQTINTDFQSSVNTLEIQKLMTPNVNSTTSKQETIPTVNKNNTRTSREKVNGQKTGNPMNLSTNSTPHQSNNSSTTTPTLRKIKNFISVNDSDNVTSNNQSLNLNNLIPLNSLKIEESMQQNIEPVTANQANIPAVNENETAMRAKKGNITDAVDPKNLLKENSPDQPKDLAISTPPFRKNGTLERMNDSINVISNNQSLNADNLSPHNSLKIKESMQQNIEPVTANQVNIPAVNKNDTTIRAKKVNSTDAVDPKNLVKENSPDQPKDLANATPPFLENETNEKINDSHNDTSKNQSLNAENISPHNSLKIKESIPQNINLTTSNQDNITAVNENETAMTVEKVNNTDELDPKNLVKENSPDQPKDLAISTPPFQKNETLERMNDSINVTSNNQSLNAENLSPHNSLKIEESIPRNIEPVTSNQVNIPATNKNDTAMKANKVNNTDAVDPKNLVKENSPDQPKDLRIATPPFLKNKTYEKINNSNNNTSNNQSLNAKNLSPHNSHNIEESIPQHINLTTSNQEIINAVNGNETAMTVKKVNITDAVDSKNLLKEDSPDQSKYFAIATPPYLQSETSGRMNDFNNVPSNNQTLNADNLSLLNSLEIAESIQKNMNLTTSNHENITALNKTETAMGAKKIDITDAVDPKNLLEANSSDQSKNFAIATPPFLENETYEKINNSNNDTSNNQSLNAEDLSPHNSLKNKESILQNINITKSNQEIIYAVNGNETAMTVEKVNITDAVDPKNLLKENSPDQPKDLAISTPPFRKNGTLERMNDSINVISNNQSLNADNLSPHNSLKTEDSLQQNIEPLTSNQVNISAVNKNNTAMKAKKANNTDAVDPKNLAKENSRDQPKDLASATPPCLENETYGKINESNKDTLNNQSLNAENLSPRNSLKDGESIPQNINLTINGNETAMRAKKVNITDAVDPKNLLKKDSSDLSKNFANATPPFLKNETSGRMNDSNDVTSNNQTLHADDLSPLNSFENEKSIPKNVNLTTSNHENITAINGNETAISVEKENITDVVDPKHLQKQDSSDQSKNFDIFTPPFLKNETSEKINDSIDVTSNNQSLNADDLSPLNSLEIGKSIPKNVNLTTSNHENITAIDENETAMRVEKVNTTDAVDSENLLKKDSSDQSKDFDISAPPFLKNETSEKINDSINVTSINQTLHADDLSPLNSLEIGKSIPKNMNLTTSNLKNNTTVNGNKTAMSVEKVNITDVVDPKHSQKQDSSDQSKNFANATPPFLKNGTFARINDSNNVTSNNQTLNADDLSPLNSLESNKMIPQNINIPISNHENITTINGNETAMRVEKVNTTDAVDSENLLKKDSSDQSKDFDISAPPFLKNETSEKVNDSINVTSINQTLHADDLSPLNSLESNKMIPQNINIPISNHENITTINGNETAMRVEKVNTTDAVDSENSLKQDFSDQSKNFANATPPFLKNETSGRMNDSNDVTLNNQTLNADNLSRLNSFEFGKSIPKPMNLTTLKYKNITAINGNETAMTVEKVKITDAVDPKNLIKKHSPDQSKDLDISTPPFLKNETSEIINDSINVTSNDQTLHADDLSPLNSLEIGKSIPKNMNLTTSNIENNTTVNGNKTGMSVEKVNITDVVDPKHLQKQDFSDQSKNFANATPPFLKNETSGRMNDSNDVTLNNQTLNADNLSRLNSFEFGKSIPKPMNLTTLNYKNITAINNNETAMTVEKVNITDAVDPKNLLEENSPDQSKDLVISTPPFLKNKTSEKINDSINVTSNDQTLHADDLSPLNSLEIGKSIPKNMNLTTSNIKNNTTVNGNKTGMSVEKVNITDVVDPKHLQKQDFSDQSKNFANATPPFLKNETSGRMNDSNDVTSNNQTLNADNLSRLNSFEIGKSIPKTMNLTTLNYENITAINNNETAMTVEKVNITDAVDPKNLLKEHSPDQSKDLDISTPPFLKNETSEKINDSINVTSNNQSLNADNLSPLNSFESEKSIPKNVNPTTSNHETITAINGNETAMSVEKVNITDVVDPKNLQKKDSYNQSKNFANATPPFRKNETFARMNDFNNVTSNNQTLNADDLSPLNSLKSNKMIPQNINLPTSNYENIDTINGNETVMSVEKVNITDAVDSENLQKKDSSDQSKDFAISTPRFLKNETSGRINDSNNVTSNNQTLNADDLSLLNSLEITKSIQKNMNLTTSNIKNNFTVNGNITGMSVEKVNITDVVDPKHLQKQDSSDQSKNFANATPPFLKNETSGRMNDSNNVTSNNQTFNADDLSPLNSLESEKSISQNINLPTSNQENITAVNEFEIAMKAKNVNITDAVDPRNLLKKNSSDQSKNFANATPPFRKNETSARTNDSSKVTSNNQTLNAVDLFLLTSLEIGKFIPKNTNLTTSNRKNITAATKNEKVMSIKKVNVRNAEYPENLFKNVSFDQSNDSVTSILHLPNNKISGKVNYSDEEKLYNQSSHTVNLFLLNSQKIKKSKSQKINSSSLNQENTPADNKNETAVTKTKKIVTNSEDSIFLLKNGTLVQLNDSFYNYEAIRELLNMSQLVDSSQSISDLFGSTISFPIPSETLIPTTLTNFSKIPDLPFIIEEKTAKASNFSLSDPSNQEIHKDYIIYNVSQYSPIPSDHSPEDDNSKNLEVGGSRSPASVIDIFSDLSLKSTSTESTDQPDHPIVQLSGIANDKEFSSSSTQPTTESKNSDSTEKTSDTTMLIFYASLSLPILLTVAYTFYVISLILRRRCRSHLE